MKIFQKAFLKEYLLLFLGVLFLIPLACSNQNSNPASSNPNSTPTYTFKAFGSFPACDIGYRFGSSSAWTTLGGCGSGGTYPVTQISLPWSYSFSSSAGVTYSFYADVPYSGSGLNIQVQKNRTTVNSATATNSGCCDVAQINLSVLP